MMTHPLIYGVYIALYLGIEKVPMTVWQFQKIIIVMRMIMGILAFPISVCTLHKLNSSCDFSLCYINQKHLYFKFSV